VLAVNVKAPFFLVAELAPAMAKRGHGAIINVTTMVAEFGAPEIALYGSSKAALVLLTKSWPAVSKEPRQGALPGLRAFVCRSWRAGAGDHVA
jgi:NAD(P)-dependent dehydrogenase (short-subunit alcohol dehydrogenase family)